jgi:hypothetical protein
LDRCPTDANIFPSLEVVSDGRTLIGRFDAFKFADDQVVRFRVNVHFCVGPCKVPQCDSTSESKPNLNGSSAVTITTDNEIQAEKSGESESKGTVTIKHDRRPLNDRSITIESSSEDSVIEDAQPEESDSSVSLRAAVARLFSRRKRSDDRFARVKKNGPKTSALRTPADAELKREIIVQGLSNTEEDREDDAAKLLYNQSNLSFCFALIVTPFHDLLMKMFFFFVMKVWRTIFAYLEGRC